MLDEKKVLEIFAKVMGVEESVVTDETSYESYEPWDSFRHLQMISDFEDEFHIEIETDDVIAMETFAKIKEILKKYIE